MVVTLTGPAIVGASTPWERPRPMVKGRRSFGSRRPGARRRPGGRTASTAPAVSLQRADLRFGGVLADGRQSLGPCIGPSSAWGASLGAAGMTLEWNEAKRSEMEP